jgi:hypothetical protein
MSAMIVSTVFNGAAMFTTLPAVVPDPVSDTAAVRAPAPSQAISASDHSSTLMPASLHNRNRPARMQARRQRRTKLPENPPTMSSRIRLSLVFNRIIYG